MQTAESDYLYTPVFHGKNKHPSSEEVCEPDRPEAGTRNDALQNDDHADLLERKHNLEFVTEVFADELRKVKEEKAALAKKMKALSKEVSEPEGSEAGTREDALQDVDHAELVEQNQGLKFMIEDFGEELHKLKEEKAALADKVEEYEGKINNFEKRETENKDRCMALLTRLNNFLECENQRLREQQAILQYAGDVLSGNQHCGSPSWSNPDETQGSQH